MLSRSLSTLPPVNQIEPIHLAVVHRQMRVFPLVAEIARHAVGRVSERDLLAGRDDAGGRAFGAGEGSEVVVEGAVLLDDEDDVLDSRSERRQSRDRGRAGG